MPVIFSERTVFYRERAASMYAPRAISLAQAVAELPYWPLQARLPPAKHPAQVVGIRGLHQQVLHLSLHAARGAIACKNEKPTQKTQCM